MKAKIVILFFSALTAIVLIAAGYGLWEERLTIIGSINVIRPQVETQVILKELPVDTENLTPGAIDIDNTTSGAIDIDNTTSGAIDMVGTTSGAISTGAISTDGVTEGAITTGEAGTDNVNEGGTGSDITTDGDIATDMETETGAEQNINTGVDNEEVHNTEAEASIQEQPVIGEPEPDNKPEDETKDSPDTAVPAQEPTVDTAADLGTAAPEVSNTTEVIEQEAVH